MDLLSVNTVQQCDEGSWMPIIIGNKPTGTELLVIGDHSDEVKQHNKNKLKAMAKASQRAERTKNHLNLMMEMIEEASEKTIEDAIVRVKDWRGVSNGPYDKELLKVFLRNNPQYITEIIEHSKEMANFTKAL